MRVFFLLNITVASEGGGRMPIVDDDHFMHGRSRMALGWRGGGCVLVSCIAVVPRP